MDTLSEFAIVMHKPQQTILLMPEIMAPYKALPLTKREKLFNILEIIGYVLGGLFLLGLTAFSIWGMILYPWTIIFLPLGFLFGAINNR